MTNAQQLKRSAVAERLTSWFGSERGISFFLDTKKNPKTVFQILNICRTVLTKWCRAFSTEKFAFFDLTDCSKCDGLLTFTQEEELKKHFTEHLPLKAGEICACVLAEYSQNYGASGASKFMKLLGFVYKNPIALSMQADEDAQRKFIDWYEALRGSLGNNETILFADAVPPRVSKPFGSCLVPEGSIDGN